MHISERFAREERRTQKAPVDLEHGRFEPSQITALWAIAAGAIAAGSVGGLLASWGLAGTTSSWGWVAAASTWLAMFGALLLALSYALATAITVLAARGWWRHQQRVDDWHWAQLEAYEAAGGVESVREVAQRTLSTQEPAHALLVALHVVQQAREGVATPWSSPKLAAGPLFYQGVRLGEVSKPEAEAFSRLLAEVGAVVGRRKGHAGQLAAVDEGQLLQLVAKNYGKYVPGRVERPELEGPEQ